MGMETFASQNFPNGVTVIVQAGGKGYRPSVLVPSEYGHGSIVHQSGAKLGYVTVERALKAGVKDAIENYQHIIDPDTYWA